MRRKLINLTFPEISILLIGGFLIASVRMSRGQQVVKQVVNVGENLSLSCFPPRKGYKQIFWEQTRGAIAAKSILNITLKSLEGYNKEIFPIIPSNTSFSYDYIKNLNSSNSSLALHIMEANINDSGNYM